MKKIRKFPFERIPGFVFYVIAAIVVLAGFKSGKHCFFTGCGMYIIGMILDPKSDLYDKK